MKAADVSRSITALSVIANNTNGESVATSMTANAMALASYTAVMKKLNDRLNEPFVTVNTVTGGSGIKKSQDDYSKLMKNKTNKRKR